MKIRALGFTGEQIRAARALARIEQTELARLSRLSLETIKRLERIRGPVEANSRSLTAIAEAFESLGIYFDGGDDGSIGVSWTPQRLRTDMLARPAAPRREGRPGSPLHRMIYFSAASPETIARLKTLVDDIWAAAERRNRELGVTGALFACEGRFLQVLEGPKDAVRQIYGAISADPRHSGLTLIENRAVASRQFSDWSMCCGLFRTDDEILANEPALQHGFHPETLSPAAALGLLSVVRDLQATAPRTRRGAVGGCCSLAGECLDCVCVTGALRSRENLAAPA